VTKTELKTTLKTYRFSTN